MSYSHIFGKTFLNHILLIFKRMSPKQLYPRFINIWENVPKTTFRSSRPEVFSKKGVLRNFTKFTGKHLCQSLFFKKETLAHVFSCEFWEISKNTFLHRTPLVAASELYPHIMIFHWFHLLIIYLLFIYLSF